MCNGNRGEIDFGSSYRESTVSFHLNCYFKSMIESCTAFSKSHPLYREGHISEVMGLYLCLLAPQLWRFEMEEPDEK